MVSKIQTRLLTVALIVSSLLTGCGAPPSTAPEANYNTDAQDNTPPAILFHCERDKTILITFHSEQALLDIDNTEIRLPQQPAASGFYYSNGKYSVRGKGDKLTLEIGRMAPLECTQQ